MSENTVRSIGPGVILNQFFDRVFGEQTGWAYTATKKPQEDKRGAWEKKFFRYPEHKKEMIDFIISSSADKDVYYSPALYKNDRSDVWDDDGNYIPNSITKEDFQGSYFVWADFDSGLPDDEKLKDIPAPTMKIRSSTNKRQHWYWHLSFCETNPDALEKITRALTYHLGADLSGWDYQQVLRPPGTIHHGSGKTVEIIHQEEDRRVPLEALLNIPAVPDMVWDVEIDEEFLESEASIKTLLRYPIPPNDCDLILKKNQEVGKRSSALTRVGYVCAEAGMNNTEIYSVLKNCDTRWKKYEPRGPELQKKYLVGIIRYVRQKYPLHITDELEETLPYYRYGEFASMDMRVEWIVEGLIQKNGIPMITSLSNVGKTHMTFQLACHMVVGKPFLTWNFARPMSLCICSNELSPPETKEELDKIIATFTKEEQEILAKNLHVIPLGHRLSLNKVKYQDQLLRRLDQHNPEGIFFDSLGQTISESPSNDEVINDTFDFVKHRVNQGHDAFSWFIHHMRKAQGSRTKPKEPDDIYGSAYILNHATTVINLWKDRPGDSIIEFNYLKVRFAKFPENFKIRRIDPCGFEIVSNSYVDLTGGDNPDDNDFGNLSL